LLTGIDILLHYLSFKIVFNRKKFFLFNEFIDWENLFLEKNGIKRKDEN